MNESRLTPITEPNINYTEADIEKICSILQTISKQYPDDSNEAHALKNAAQAFTFLVQHSTLKSAFEKYQDASKRPLNPAEIDHLKSMGIKP